MPSRRVPVLKLSPTESLILQLLAADECYGLQLVAASKGKLKRGTVYVTLGRMEDKGYVSSRLDDGPPEGGGLPLRLYRTTPLGAHVLSASKEAARLLVPKYAR